MRNLALVCMVGAFLGIALRASAQEKSRTFCDPADPKNKCPDPKTCVCTEDVMEITFDRDGTNDDSIFEYETFVANTAVDVTVMMDVKTNGPGDGDGIQGWSYGVDHDDAFLTISAVTVDGTDAERAKNGGFVVADFNAIQTCRAETPPACKNPQPGSGFISAIILSFTQAAELETRRNKIAKAKYTLTADPGPTGTLIDFTDRLKKTGSPPADINITINGISKSPTTLIDGLVVRSGGCTATGPENLATAGSCTDGKDNDCDGFTDADDPDCKAPAVEVCNNGKDDDQDGKIDCDDPDCVGKPECPGGTCDDNAFYFGASATNADLAVGAGTEYAISMRNKAASLGFQLGVKATKAGATTTWQFAGTLGADANRLIELIITDDQGNSQTPLTPNKATSSTDTVSEVQRGAAISGFNDRDFFASDLAPGVGGPGFTVGYVADTSPPAGAGHKIPATGSGNPCPVGEILKVKLGGVPPTNLSRGDANGDSKINVTDAVLIIQIVVGNLQKKFNCEDVLDANDDGRVTVTDAIPVLAYVFQKGPNLAAPFRSCGPDGTADTLVCTQSNCQ